MTSSNTPGRVLAFATITLVAVACSEPTSPSGPDTAPLYAKGGNGGGKGGGGSTGSGPFPATATIRNTANLIGDGVGDYVDGECGVQAEVGTDIGLLKPAGNRLTRKEERSCTVRSAAVKLTLQHLSADPADHSHDVPVDESWTLISLKPRLDDGPSARMTVNAGRCDTGLEFDDVEYPGASRVNVDEVAAGSTWAISTLAYPDNLAGCRQGASTSYLHLDIDFDMARN